MGSLDKIARARAQGRTVSAGGGGSLDRIAAHRSAGGTGIPSDVGVAGIPTVGGGGPPRHSGGHGGFLGGLERGAHWVAGKTELAAHDLKAMPGGIYDMVNTEQHLLRLTLAHPLADPNDPRYGVNASKWGRHANDLVHGIEQSTVQSVEHPLRDPFATAATVLPFAHGLGKVADVASAGRLSAASRGLDVGGERVPLQESRNPAVKALQLAHDRLVQHAIDTNPEGKLAGYGNWRAGGAIAETARMRARLRQVPAAMLDQAAKRISQARHPRVSRLNQAALELTSVNTSPEDAAAYHLRQAEAGVNPRLNRVVAKLYQGVSERGLLARNEHGDTIVNAAAHPKLAAADLRLGQLQGRGDEILARYGVRTPEQLAERVSAPGRIRAGATYEKPTPAKEGVPSQSLLRQRSRVVRLEALHERAAAKAAEGKFAASQKKLIGDVRPAREDEGLIAEKIDATNKAVTALRKQLPADSPEVVAKVLEKTAWQKLQIARGDMAKAAEGLEGAHVPSPQAIEAKIESLRGDIKQMRGERDPQLMKSLRRAESEANRLRRERRAAEAGGRRTDAGVVYTSKGARLEPIGYARSQKLGAALSLERDRLSSMESAAAKRVKPTGIVGGDTARPGRGFVSYALEQPRAPKSQIAASSGPVVGEVKPPITSKNFTGTGIEQGRVPKHITGPAAQHYGQIIRFVNTSEHRAQAIRTGATVRRSSRDVLVKVPGESHEKIPAAVNEILGKSKLTTDDVEGINAALQAYKEDLIPGLRNRFANDRAAGIGAKAPDGYRWVDRNTLGSLGSAGRGPRSWVGRQMDSLNSAVTAATVYFKVGHIGTRVLTNAATNIIQGSAAPTDIAKSFTLWRTLSEQDRARALAAAGQHGISSLPHEGVNKVARVAGAGANWWARHIDSPFRFNALAYEARRAGIDTPAAFRGFLDKLENPEGLNAAQTAKVDWIAKRANREAIAYDRLSEAERRYIARAVWFYPWIKGTVGFLGNTALEHPYKAAALGRAGEVGRQNQQQQLGDLPSYEGGLFRLSGGQQPLVTDFSTFSPFATPADVADAVARPKTLSGMLNPSLTAGTNLIFGLNQYGSQSKSPLEDAFASLVSPAPEAQIVSAYANRRKDQNRHMFPASPAWYGTRNAILRALVGPGMPRRLNPTAAHSSAARERTGR